MQPRRPAHSHCTKADNKPDTSPDVRALTPQEKEKKKKKSLLFNLFLHVKPATVAVQGNASDSLDK